MQERLGLVLPAGQQQVAAPVLRIEAPVTRPILHTPMGVAYETGRSQQQPAILALDAGSQWRRVQLRLAQPIAFAETLVMDPEPTISQWEERGGGVTGAPQEGAAKPLGIRFSDEPAAGGAARQDRRRFQTVQLLGAAQRAVDLQFVAHAVDLHDVELAQDRIEDLRQT